MVVALVGVCNVSGEWTKSYMIDIAGDYKISDDTPVNGVSFPKLRKIVYNYVCNTVSAGATKNISSFRDFPVLKEVVAKNLGAKYDYRDVDVARFGESYIDIVSYTELSRVDAESAGKRTCITSSGNRVEVEQISKLRRDDILTECMARIRNLTERLGSLSTSEITALMLYLHEYLSVKYAAEVKFAESTEYTTDREYLISKFSGKTRKSVSMFLRTYECMTYGIGTPEYRQAFGVMSGGDHLRNILRFEQLL